MILCVKSLYKYTKERTYSLPAYDKDCIDKSGTEIALSGRSECFGREVSGGGDQGRGKTDSPGFGEISWCRFDQPATDS